MPHHNNTKTPTIICHPLPDNPSQLPTSLTPPHLLFKDSSKDLKHPYQPIHSIPHHTNHPICSSFTPYILTHCPHYTNPLHSPLIYSTEDFNHPYPPTHSMPHHNHHYANPLRSPFKYSGEDVERPLLDLPPGEIRPLVLIHL